MKNFKRIISVLIAVMMLTVSFCVGVMADDATGTITLRNDKSKTHVSIAGKEYTAYKLYDLKQNEDHSTYAYTLNEAFSGFFASDEFAAAFPSATVEETKASSIYDFTKGLSTAADIEKFANAVYAYIQANTVSGAITKTAAATADTNIETAVFDELALGYYIIYGTGISVDASKEVVAACVLDTTTFENDAYAVTIDVKVGVPTVDKNIVQNKGETGEKEVDADTVSIGDTIDFRVTSEVPDLTGYTAYTFKMTDTMSKGLTYNNDMAVKIDGNVVVSENYVVETERNEDTGITTITVTFKDFYTFIKDSGYAQGKAVTFDYSAKLNADAVIGTAGNDNTAKITYSNDPQNKTTNDTTNSIVKVYTLKFDIYKYTNVGTANTPLEGAEFTLTKKGQTERIKFVKTGDGKYRIATAEDTETVTTIISAATGYINIEGLGKGDYVLTETKAPEGYNLLEASIDVTIAPEYDTTDTTKLNQLSAPASGAAYANLADNSGIEAQVENTTGTELPSTGGMGTTILYIIGGLLIAVALIGFTVKKVADRG